MLLPSNHFLYWKPIRFIVYTVNYVVLSLFSFPAVYLATRETKITKYDIFTENHVSYPDIFKDDVLVIVLGSRNLDSYYSLIGYPLIVVYGLFLTVSTNWAIFNILKKHEVTTMSETSRRHHIEVLKALMGLVS